MLTTLPTPEAERRERFIERIGLAAAGAFDLASIFLGERLGLYRALRDHGPATAADLAAATGLKVRPVREWLEHGAVGGLLEVASEADDPDRRRFALPSAHAAVLLDADAVGYSTPSAIQALAALTALPDVLDAFRTGRSLPFGTAGDDMRTGEASANRPAYLGLLGREWLPAMPDVDARLRAAPPARVADVGCGFGWSSIGIAQAYPDVEVRGLDLDEPSIQAARRNAREAGVEDRLSFAVGAASDGLLDGAFDLITIFEAFHDMAHPVAVLRALRDRLAAGGSLLVADTKTAETFAAPGDDAERLHYGWSLVHCLYSSLEGPPDQQTGTVMRPATLRRYAEAAGLGRVEIVPIEHDSWRFYRLRP